MFIFIKNHTDIDKVTEWKFYKQFSEQGINVIPVIVNFSYIYDDDGKFYIRNKFIKNKFKSVEIEQGDIFFVRAASLSNRNSYRLLTHLEEIGKKLQLKFFNGNDYIQMCNDKFRNYLFLKEQNINTPDTYFVPYVDMSRTDKQLKEIADKIGYPLIMKTVEGSMGTGVVLIESDNQIQSIAEVLYKGNGGIILQKMIESDFDVRVFVWGKRIITSMRRNKIEGDFRSNVSKGSKSEKYELSEKELAFVEDVIEKVNGKFGAVGTIGIDYMVDKDGSLQILEINGSPGIKIKKTTGVDVLEEIGKTLLEDYPDLANTEVEKVEEKQLLNLTESINHQDTKVYVNESYTIDSKANIELTDLGISGKIIEQLDDGYFVATDDELIRIKNIQG